MKKIISLIVIVVFAGIVASWMIRGNHNLSRIIQESDLRLEEKEKEIITLKTEVGQKVREIKRIEAKKKEIEENFKTVSSKINRKPRNYEKATYDSLLGQTLSLQLKFKKYITLDQERRKITKRFIESYQQIDDIRIEQISNLKLDRNHIASIKRSRLAAVIGPAVLVSPRGVHVGLALTIGYRIL